MTAAIERLDSFEPFVMSSPVTLDVQFKSYRPAQIMSYLSIVEQVDSHTIRYIGNTIVDISKFIEFLTTYNVAIEP